MKNRITGGINALFEKQEIDYHKPVRVCKFQNNNYIEYKSDGEKNKNLSVKEYLNEIKPYLGDIIINHSTITINFISSKDVEQENLMHLKEREYRIYVL